MNRFEAQRLEEIIEFAEEILRRNRSGLLRTRFTLEEWEALYEAHMILWQCANEEGDHCPSPKPE